LQGKGQPKAKDTKYSYLSTFTKRKSSSDHGQSHYCYWRTPIQSQVATL